MRLIYQFFTELYFFAVKIASLWNQKAKLFVNGRKETKSKLNLFERENDNLYWFHCASLGEFEQARPLIESIKSKEKCKIVITFFSPSGYEIRKNYEQADLVLYLPKDSKKNARFVLNHLKPTKIFFVKYEFWPNYLMEANELNIPIYLVSGVFRKSQVFFKWYGDYMRKVLGCFNLIYVQNKASLTLLQTINVKSIHNGDTRYDRVMSNAENVKSFPEIERFIDGKNVMVLGSAWPEDEAVLFPVLNGLKDIKIIVAPHEITDSHIKGIKIGLSKKTIRYSELIKNEGFDDCDVLIIDNIGMLMHLYQYAKVAFIGGAFGNGLHNILEPASFGVPVIFGPKYSKFPEAYEFIEHKIGVSIYDSNTFSKALLDYKESDEIKHKVSAFMHSRVGATAQIMKNVFADKN